MMKIKKCWTLLIAILFSFNILILHAGTLGDFEQEVTKDKEKYYEEQRKKDESSSESDDTSFLQELMGAVLQGLFETAVEVASEIYTQVEENNPAFKSLFTWKRRIGEYKMPFAQVDWKYHNVDGDITAQEYRVEGGYGPLALQLRQTAYEEKNPKDKLTLGNFYAMLRLPIGRRCQAHAGFGTATVQRQQHSTGGSFTFPVMIRPTSYMHIEFRPQWSKIAGNKIRDYDVSVLLGKRYIGLRTGYRWVKCGATSLKGPYTGLSIYF